MRSLVREALTAFFAAAALSAGAPASVAEAPHRRVVVFTKTAGFRHDSIPEAIDAVLRLGADGRFAVDATEDAARFTDDGLSPYDAVLFLLTTGDVLDAGQEAALQGYRRPSAGVAYSPGPAFGGRLVRSGRGFIGVHWASDTEHGSEWFRALVGAEFASHPAIQPARLRVEDLVHASTRALPESWPRTDEWYNFTNNPRGTVHVLVTLDESTYGGGAMGTDHPISWCRYFEGGRTWYTALGHTRGSYAEPLFLEHLAGGIRFAAGYPDCDAASPRTVPPRP